MLRPRVPIISSPDAPKSPIASPVSIYSSFYTLQIVGLAFPAVPPDLLERTSSRLTIRFASSKKSANRSCDTVKGKFEMKSAPTSRIPSLDGIRATAILFVISAHIWSRLVGPSGASLGASLLLAAFGVHVFFVLSGYLITRLLQEEHERTGRTNLAAFYRRRCFRIFPAAFTYILIVALLSPVARPGLLYALTYTVSYHLNKTPFIFVHLWSLSVEEQFYLLWPLALVLGFRRRAWIRMVCDVCSCQLPIGNRVERHIRSCRLSALLFLGNNGQHCRSGAYWRFMSRSFASASAGWPTLRP